MRVGGQAWQLVTAPYSRVVLGDFAEATEPPIESVSVTRELPSGLPGAVVGGKGIAAATADVTWAQPEAIRDTDISPWRHADKPAIPLPGTPVRILMGADAGLNQYVFTGEVDNSEGSTGSSVRSSMVDHLYARFHRQVSISPKARWMYPPREAAPYRQVGLTYVYVVDAILRECGYYTTPPPEHDVVVSIPGQGTMWPAIGRCETAGVPAGSTTGNSHASFPQADGRLYITDGAATITPAESRPVTAGVQISLEVGADHAGLTNITVPYGSSYVQLRITATGNAGAYWSGTFVTGVYVPSVRGTTVSLLVRPDGTWSLQSTSSSPATGTQALSGGTMGDVTVSVANGGRVAGIQVSHPAVAAHEHASLLYVKNAHIRPGGVTHGLLDVHRAINSEKALDVLSEIADATLSQFRLDEDGHARWDGPGVLAGQSPVGTWQARTNLLSMAWRVSLDHVRASTVVEWDRPAISRSRWPKITLYDGRSESLVVGDELADFIEVPSGEEWLGVHLPAVYAGADTGGDERVNRGVGSVMGGASINTSGDPSGVWFSPTYGSASIESVGDGKYLYKMTVNSLPGGGAEFVTQMTPGGGGLWPKNDGAALPILRGYIKASWARQNRRCQSTYLGDPARPHLVHDGGGWLQQGPGFTLFGDGDQPGKAANWIQQQCITPVVEVTGCEIMPDPRIQLGDVINIADPDNLAVQIRGLVTGIDLSQSGPDMSMSLSLQVIAATPTAVTYAELEDLWAGADYAAFEAAWTGDTYADFEADPLKETP